MAGTALLLRRLLDQPALVVAPGAYDALTARLIAQHGFPAVYMTGAGTAAGAGYPDYGLLTMTEMVENAARITDAVAVPVVADADTGFGNELNVVRTVRAYARAGVAALHIEDQAFPKRCGHLAGKEIIDTIRGCARSAPPPSAGPTPTSSSSPAPTPGRWPASTRPSTGPMRRSRSAPMSPSWRRRRHSTRSARFLSGSKGRVFSMWSPVAGLPQWRSVTSKHGATAWLSARAQCCGRSS